MKKKQTNPEIGRGVYRIADAARYLRVPAQTLYAWFGPRSEGGPNRLLYSDYRRKNGAAYISFLDLVDALVAVRLRERGVKLKEIRSAYDALAKQLDTNHPFAHADIRHANGAVLTKAGIDEETKFYEVVNGQQFFRHFEPLLERIDFSENHLAALWRIAEGVEIRPDVQFGTPVVANTRVPTETIYSAFMANGEDAEFVAWMYGLEDSQQVLNAVAFHENLKAAA